MGSSTFEVRSVAGHVMGLVSGVQPVPPHDPEAPKSHDMRGAFVRPVIAPDPSAFSWDRNVPVGSRSHEHWRAAHGVRGWVRFGRHWP